MDLSALTVTKVEKEDGITFVSINRPEKRNAMNPQVHREMYEILGELEGDPETQVLVISGVGETWSAGQDLKEYFREMEGRAVERKRIGELNEGWRRHRLYAYDKPTIAEVNGYCFGGAFTQLITCDFAIAADEAIFGLSEVNWGILPGGVVSWVVANCLNQRDAMWYACTGESFDGKTAEKIGLVNKSVPRAQLRQETIKLAKLLMEKNPWVLRATKQVIRQCRNMDYHQAYDYLAAKGAQIRMMDKEDAFHTGLKQFLDDKTYRPGLGAFKRPDAAE